MLECDITIVLRCSVRTCNNDPRCERVRMCHSIQFTYFMCSPTGCNGQGRIVASKRGASAKSRVRGRASDRTDMGKWASLRAKDYRVDCSLELGRALSHLSRFGTSILVTAIWREAYQGYTRTGVDCSERLSHVSLRSSIILGFLPHAVILVHSAPAKLAYSVRVTAYPA